MKLTLRPAEILLLALISGVLQLVFVHYIPGGSYLDLAVVLAVYIGWYSDPVKGALSGSLLGLVQDVTQLAPFLGLNGLSKTVAGFVSGRLSQRFVVDGYLSRGLLIAVMSLANDFVIGALLTLLRDAGSFSLGAVAIKAGVTGVFGAGLFQLLDTVRVRPKDFTRLE